MFFLSICEIVLKFRSTMKTTLARSSEGKKEKKVILECVSVMQCKY